MTGDEPTTNDDMTWSQRRKSRVAGLILASAVLVVTMLANLPFQYAEVEARWLGAMEVNDTAEFRRYLNLPRMAGWPLNYWVQYERHGELQDRFWSTPHLVFNLGLGVAVALMAYLFLQWRSRRLFFSRNRQRTRLMFDAGIALVILALPAAVVGWEYRVSRHHQRLAGQLLRSGNVYVSCWLPQPMVKHVPARLMKAFLRVRMIRTVGLESGIEQVVLSTPTLVGLMVDRGELSTETIEQLGDNPHFAQFQLSHNELTAEDIEAIGRLPWLVALRLRDTNLDEKMLRRLDHLPLISVDLRNNDLALSDIGTPGWSSTVVDLKLSRPSGGVSDSLVLDRWPNLQELSVSRLSRIPNSEILSIELSNLPRLERLVLSRLQKHRLVLRHVPRLSRVDEGVGDLRYLIGYEDLLPGLTWVTELEVNGAASLKEISCFARDLESMKLQNMPNLRVLSLGSYLTTMMGDMQAQPADPDHCQAWIEQLGERVGPSTLDLTALPLEGSDLSPLANNSRIRHLRLGRSGVEFQQIQSLAGMKQLESLDISNCPLERDELSWLLDQFPNMKSLEVDGSTLGRLDLQSGMQLKRLGTTPLRSLRELRILDLPSLKAHLRMSQTPSHMEIRNARSLMGLVIEAPWPEDATVQGLYDLEWFAGGGPAIGDSLVDVLLQCRKLDQLTLAYGSVSREKLMDIGELTDLTLLAVPGAEVDDEVTDAWKKLNMLWEVNLDDTSVSADTIAWLGRVESLRRLSLNRVPLNDAAIELLASMSQLSELRLAEVPVDLRKLQPLLRAGNLASLDLSGRKVDDRLLDLLEEPHGLKHLVLHGAEIDAELLKRVIASHPSLYVDVGRLPEEISDEMALELHERAITVQSEFIRNWPVRYEGLTPFNWRIEMTDDPRQMMSVTMPKIAGRINTQPFRTAQVAATQDREFD